MFTCSHRSLLNKIWNSFRYSIITMKHGLFLVQVLVLASLADLTRSSPTGYFIFIFLLLKLSYLRLQLLQSPSWKTSRTFWRPSECLFEHWPLLCTVWWSCRWDKMKSVFSCSVISVFIIVSVTWQNSLGGYLQANVSLNQPALGVVSIQPCLMCN